MGGKKTDTQEDEGSKTSSTSFTLTYETEVSVSINGKSFTGTELTFPSKEEADEAKRIIFESNGITPIK